MKYYSLIAAVLLFIFSCSTDSARLMDQDQMDEIRSELGLSGCEIRMDSLGFEIEGILYHASLTPEGYTSIEELLPDSLPGCPLSNQPYIINESDSDIVITCPFGHGSVLVLK